MVIYIHICAKVVFRQYLFKNSLLFLKHLILKLLFICTIFLIVSGGKAEPRPSLFIDKYCHYTLHIQTSRALYTLQCMCILLYILYTVGYFFTSLFCQQIHTATDSVTRFRALLFGQKTISRNFSNS